MGQANGLSRHLANAYPGGILQFLNRNTRAIGLGDRVFTKAILVCGIAIVVLLLGIFVTLMIESLPAIRAFGIGFIGSKNWDPVAGAFGGLPFLVGTLITSLLALGLAVPFAVSIAILLGEYWKRGPHAGLLRSAVDLLAGIPSVIYGFWGLMVLVPLVRTFELKIHVAPYGVGIFTASIVLAVMIIPYAAALGREVIELVPADLKEAAYSMGATRSEVVRRVILPHASSGILAGILLALGRAVGETMAVTMVIGNSNFLPKSIFSPANTMASVIANEFTEATDEIHLASLVEIGLLLFAVTIVINIVGRYIIHRASVEA